MTHQFSKTMVTFGILVASAFTAQASADTYEHLDRLAVRVERSARLLVSEMRHYRHTPEYAHLRADAKEMRRLASHMHETAHHHGSLKHLARDLAELDSSFHHFESTFARVEHNAAYGHGHVHGNTAHVRRLIRSIENDIHHLREDVNTLRRPVYVHPRPIRHYNFSNYGTYGHPIRYGNSYGRSYGHGSGFTLGGGSSQLTFRF